jgi:hypothetical protein
MKKIFTLLLAATVAVGGYAQTTPAKNPPANKKPATPVLLVEPTTIAVPYPGGSYTFALAAHSVWSAAVNTDAVSWCWVQPTSGNGDKAGTIAVMYNPTVSARTATITFTSGALTRKVTIKQETGVSSAPPHAESGSTWMWVFGNQVWSNAIHMPECNHEGFFETDSDPYCCNHNYTEDGKTLYYYNWLYVNKYKAKMCPSPWRVPTKSDFETLLNNTDYTALSNAWGYYGDDRDAWMNNHDWTSYYWSSSKDESDPDPSLYAYSLSRRYAPLCVNSDRIFIGLPVRCVK